MRSFFRSSPSLEAASTVEMPVTGTPRADEDTLNGSPQSPPCYRPSLNVFEAATPGWHLHTEIKSCTQR